jgi:hypothetical protein
LTSSFSFVIYCWSWEFRLTCSLKIWLKTPTFLLFVEKQKGTTVKVMGPIWWQSKDCHRDKSPTHCRAGSRWKATVELWNFH